MPAKDRSTLLARYLDPQRRPHRVVLRGHLVLDVCTHDQPRVVARLDAEEGESQARALVDGSAIDEGYLARARREPAPFIRTVDAADLDLPWAQDDSNRVADVDDLGLAA